jgi:2-polyprenyl-6-methoxyphenol hydroxylase-like FAD-dependent oxidoreductase
VTVQHSRGQHRADLVVLADGLDSPTRHLVAGPRPQPRYAGYTAWRGITGPDDAVAAGIAAPAPGAATESWGRGQRFGIVPLADGRTYWFATANTADGQRAAGGEHDEVLRRFTGWHEPIRQVLAATDPAAVLRHDVHDLRPDPDTYVRGRLLLLGDAAHAMTPDLGQGACQALEDAVVLGAVLPVGADIDAALVHYDALRRPRAQLISRRSRALGRVGQLHGRLTTAARNRLLAAAPSTVADHGLDQILTWQPPTSSSARPDPPDRS